MHFDWSTLILQTVNVLVLLWLLRRFLFRPVAAIVTARHEAAEKLLRDAETARQQATAQADQAAQQRNALTADTDRIRNDAHAAAAAERVALLDQARHEAEMAADAAQRRLDQERAETRRALEADALRLAVTIASRLLGRMPPAPLNAAFVDALGGLPAKQWQALAEPGEAIEVVTPVPLDAAAQAACAALVQQHTGCPVRFATDPSLIAGIALKGPHARMDNSWRADLDRIAEELAQDDTHPVMA